MTTAERRAHRFIFTLIAFLLSPDIRYFKFHIYFCETPWRCLEIGWSLRILLLRCVRQVQGHVRPRPIVSMVRRDSLEHLLPTRCPVLLVASPSPSWNPDVTAPYLPAPWTSSYLKSDFYQRLTRYKWPSQVDVIRRNGATSKNKRISHLTESACDGTVCYCGKQEIGNSDLKPRNK